ncbi:hypothetical protein CCAX7_40650 [Capsulimonas corticalis]|uniref:Uncharacterized protein n=1 Tax=Capsulimonas corticalis TaxID=2219043 RepID=A0A402D6F0_9BACT|nr:phytanoyl-CoA dioxygenase family protein [Capsulimonas corticalis]BDI32014.1 hypothetical protein CCAX7_40650 [Capsulimonas corticalis]
MNRVTPKTPRDEIVALIRRDGYVLMEDALTSSQVATLSIAYDAQLARTPLAPGATRVETPRILERDPAFETLMDLPTTFPIARAVIGADIELASGGELDHKLPRTPAYISWHNDFQWMTDIPYPRQNFWLRCTYFLSDVREDTGPFTLLPGTHRNDRACPPEMNEANGQPKFIPGQIGVTGPAGSCLINNTEIWHTNSPLTGDLPRRLIMILYKHAWMKQWEQGYEITPEFADRQTDPVRRQLTGGVAWHQDRSHFPAAEI